MSTNLYDFSFNLSNNKPFDMELLKGKVVLVVNTATQCGLAPQFEGLEKLHLKYKDKGLVILGFPCNQFGKQEPETNESMVQACAINFGVSFQLLEKIEVNGKNELPLFTWLKANTNHFLFKKIKWNFTKFLIDQNGMPVKRFSPTAKPNKIEPLIQELIG